MSNRAHQPHAPQRTPQTVPLAQASLSGGIALSHLTPSGNAVPGQNHTNSSPSSSPPSAQPPTHSERTPQIAKTEAQVFSIWMLGVGVACSHHFLYWALDGRAVGTEASQRVVVGAGIVLAMITGFCFSIVASHALTQQLWNSLRQRRWKISSINALFQAETSLRWAFTGEILRHAQLVAAITLFLWLLKLLTIAPPTALSIDPAGAYSSESSLCDFSSLNFQPLPKERRWPAIVYIDGITTGTPRLHSQLERILTGSAHAWDVRLPPSPCGTNCSHAVTFHGPAYDCENSPFSATPWASDDILRESSGRRVIYISRVVNGSIWFAGSHLRPGIRNESAIFDGPDRRVDGASKVMDDDFIFQAVQCRDWNATYEATISYSGRGSAITVDRRTLLRPIDYIDDDAAVYQETNKAIHGLLGRWLQGNVTLKLGDTGNTALIPRSLLVYSTGLANAAVPYGDDENTYFYAAPNLRQAAEELHQNMTLSLLSASPNFHFISPMVKQTCTVINTVGLYKYDYRWLLGLYSGAAGTALIVFFLGVRAIWANATTRSEEFEELSKVCSEGKQPLAPELVDAEEQIEPCALDSEVLHSLLQELHLTSQRHGERMAAKYARR
ncbi:hypothetical protein B0T18DRAFT_468913 [Schizothecium vesticola]|uniref:Uncharacterized protein n=1 Tax=Schizothecium vesticola TaxID=314040 RepID=A0AA40EQB8_9PEZI|nr:hypothetical protein B0T18DRAFT_468913 [Schizothecium vesticola]